MIYTQASPWFPSQWERGTVHEQELWVSVFESQTGRLPGQRGIEGPTNLDEDGRETIAIGCLPPMASAKLQEAVAADQAALARSVVEGDPHIALPAAKKRRLMPGQEVSVWVNQGPRPATILAVVGQHALLEYVMPRGSTTLRLVSADNPDVLIRTVSYHRVPLVFLLAMREAGVDWIGEPQSGQPACLTDACLRARSRKMRSAEASGMLPLPWELAGLSLSSEPAEAGEDGDSSEFVP